MLLTNISRAAHGARLAVLLVFPLLLAACNPKMDWREFNAQDGGFTVLFPQKPGQGEHTLATPLGKVNMKMYSVLIDETALGAGFADFPATVDEATLDLMQAALVRSLGGKLVSSKPVTSKGQPGLPGREIVVGGSLGTGQKSAPAQLRARLFARDKRYFQVVLAGRQGAFEASDADMFLESFKPF
jgi:hypothetical protein